MKIICAWCQLDMGEHEPFDQEILSHGICQECAKKMEAQIDKIDEETKKRKQFIEGQS